MTTYVPPIIDLEASGFGSGSYPIEVGYALEDGCVESFLLRPQPEWTHWSDSAEAVHGISRSQLEHEGRSCREMALILNEDLKGKTLYSDAWSYDSTWLALMFDAAGLIQRFRIETISRLLSMDEMEQWKGVKDQVIKDLGIAPHRAGNDVKVLQETFARVTGDN